MHHPAVVQIAFLLPLCVALPAGCGPTTRPTPPQPPAAAQARREAPATPPARSPLDDLELVTPDEPAAVPTTAVWRVVAVADGDTVTAIDQTKMQHRIRLAGIDAPETAQPFGTVARRRLSELVKGKSVAVLVEGTDLYGRTVARLEVDGMDVCREMVAAGLAWHYRRYSDDKQLAAAEAEARKAKRGLWRDAAPVAPWEWRSTERERKAQPAGR
jgi:micrococcal nuclease